jgi:hypothetical protein
MDRILDALIAVLETNLTGRGVVSFFKGSQTIPAEADMPIVIVKGLSETTQRSGTVRDRAEFEVGIEVQVSTKQFFNSATGQGTSLKADQYLTNIIGERDADFNLLTNTFLSILNQNITLSNLVLYNDTLTVNYELLDPGEFPVHKAMLTVVVHARPNRI